MKRNVLTQMAAAATAICLGFLIVQSCGKAEDLTKDVKLTVDNDLVRVAGVLNFFDPTAPATDDRERDLSGKTLKVRFYGPDAAKLYTTIGQKLTNLTEIKGGSLDIAIKKTDWTSITAAPLSFSVEISSEGYISTSRTFTITDTVPQQQTVTIVNASRTMAGADIISRDNVLTAPANGTVAANTNVAATKGTIAIPAGTVLKDKNGAPVAGALQVQFAHFTPSNADAIAAFPSGDPSDAVVRAANGTVSNVAFTPLAFYSLNMKAGTTEVKQFGGNIQTTVDLDPNMKMPDGSSIAVGQSLPVFSLDEATNQWVAEGTVTVTGTAAAAKVTVNQTHLSSWLVGVLNALTALRTQTYVLPNTVGPSNYYVEVVNGATGAVVQSGWRAVSSSRRVAFPRLSAAYTDAYSKIYSGNSTATSCTRGNFVESQHFNPGAAPSLLTMTLNNPGNVLSLNPMIQASVSGACANQPNILLNPTVSIAFRPAGCTTPYVNLTTIVNGTGSTNLLETRKSYDFRVTIGTVTQYFLNKTVPPETVYVMPNVIIPQNYCSMFGF